MPIKVNLPDGRVVNFPDGMPPQQIEAEVAKLAGPAERPQARTWTDTAIDALPTIGGTIGSFAGGGKWNPIGMAGAAIGGVAGEGFKQTANALRGRMDLVPDSMGEQLTEIGKQGALQAGAEGGGRILSAGLKAVAKPIYNFGLAASKGLRREYPDLAETGLHAGIAVSSRGTEKAGRLLTSASKKTDDALAARDAYRPPVRGYLPEATESIPLGARPSRSLPSPAVLQRPMKSVPGPGAPPTMIDPREIAGALSGARGELSERALGAADVDQLGQLESQFLAQQSRPLSLTQANAMKRAEQKISDASYRAAEAGHPVNAVEAQFHKSIAKGAREAIERKAPEVGPLNQRTQALGGLKSALDDAETRNHILSRLIVPTAAGVSAGFGSGDVSTGLGSAATTAALTAPGNLSRGAIGLYKFGQANIPAHLLRAAILARLEDEP